VVDGLGDEKDTEKGGFANLRSSEEKGVPVLEHVLHQQRVRNQTGENDIDAVDQHEKLVQIRTPVIKKRRRGSAKKVRKER